MKDKILIVDLPNNEGKSAILEKLKAMGENTDNIQIVNHNDIAAKNIQDIIKENSYIPFKAAPLYHNMYAEKKFKCKGKHQYREYREDINGKNISSWICECGKKIE